MRETSKQDILVLDDIKNWFKKQLSLERKQTILFIKKEIEKIIDKKTDNFIKNMIAIKYKNGFYNIFKRKEYPTKVKTTEKLNEEEMSLTDIRITGELKEGKYFLYINGKEILIPDRSRVEGKPKRLHCKHFKLIYTLVYPNTKWSVRENIIYRMFEIMKDEKEYTSKSKYLQNLIYDLISGFIYAGISTNIAEKIIECSGDGRIRINLRKDQIQIKGIRKYLRMRNEL